MPEISLKTKIKRPYFKLLFRLCDRVIVHSSEDITYLSNLFNTNPIKFKFIPYYYYGDITDNTHCRPIENILAIGRHRDLNTFVKAVEKYKNMAFTILGGKEDKIDVAAPNIRCYWEVKNEEYNRLFNSAECICIPLYKDKYKRSLGQIAILKAYASGKPVIVADIPWIRDYIEESTCITYEAENEQSLREAIDKIISMTDADRQNMLQNAASFVSKFSKDNYTIAFRNLMLN